MNKFVVVLLCTVNCMIALADDTDYNNVNQDGSFNFGYSNADPGGHYHTASGNNNVKVRGRFGSRNPANGRIEETVYTSGPRGFRARGPAIARKQNLSQLPRGPTGSPDDPLSDPYDDPSYGFGFKSPTYQRREDADRTGKVQGQYIYLDDVGEKHNVKYEAGAEKGFTVENGIPDSAMKVRYNSPLYKADRSTRGKISFQQGPAGQYKFITSSPDQRRAEATGPDGITRGSYSYLDDKGVQRTVQYIAGAGIGYRIVGNTVGPGTHIAANSDVPEYSIKDVNTNDLGNVEDSPISGPSAPDYSATAPSGGSATGPSGDSNPYGQGGGYPSALPPTGYPSYSSGYPTARPSPRPFARQPDQIFVTTPTTVIHGHSTPSPPYVSGPSASGNSGTGPSAPSGPDDSGEMIYGLLPPREETLHTNLYIPPSGPIPVRPNYYPSAPDATYIPPSRGGGSSTPTPATYGERIQSTIIKNNSGRDWFFGIGPGATVRAHIQNIDLVPVRDRAPSPSEALRADYQDSFQDSRDEQLR